MAFDLGVHCLPMTFFTGFQVHVRMGLELQTVQTLKVHAVFHKSLKIRITPYLSIMSKLPEVSVINN